MKTQTLKSLSEVPGVYEIDTGFLEENQNFLVNITKEFEFEIECRLVSVCTRSVKEKLYSYFSKYSPEMQ